MQAISAKPDNIALRRLKMNHPVLRVMLSLVSMYDFYFIMFCFILYCIFIIFTGIIFTYST
jgi:hypothetical protein